MALKDRLARIEANAKVSPQLGAAVWWEQLLAKPKEDEHATNAAIFMAYSWIVQKPPPALWQPLEDRLKPEWEKLPESLFCFAVFCSIGICDDEEQKALFEEIFADEDGKEWLCLMATVYWATFKGAPLVPNPQIEKDGKGRLRAVALGNLRGTFLIPLFERIFPDLGGNRYGQFEEWLEKDGECASLLADARAFMGVTQAVAAT